jgi:rubrerythrin
MASYDFNADEIFEMAIRIESNGAAFYRKAASLQSVTSSRDFLENLATMEDHHKLVFEKMRKRLGDAEKANTVFDPEGELSLYLASMADRHGGEGSPPVADALTGKESMHEIITTAIGLEKKSILFYVGLKDMVPPKYGREKIEEIIREEQRHIVQLNAFLNRDRS